MPGRLMSMTAYGGAEFEVEGRKYTLEIRCVNSRFLDVRTSLPAPFPLLEYELSQRVSARIRRGRVEVTVRRGHPGVRGTTAAENLAEELGPIYRALEGLRNRLSMEAPVTMGDLLVAYEPPSKHLGDLYDSEAFRTACLEAADKALEDVVAMRAKEGEAMDHALAESIEAASVLIESIEALSKTFREEIAAKLKERVQALLGNQELDPVRLAQEIAYLADRADISEEVVRTKSHIDQLRKIRHGPGPHGRKMEFLLQEMHREATTISAKAVDVRISRAALELKNEIEKMRELVRNVE